MESCACRASDSSSRRSASPLTGGRGRIEEAHRQPVRLQSGMPAWTWLVPALSLALLVGGLIAGVGTALSLVCFAALIGSVIAAVHHAEVVAHRVGEPFGTLVLAVAVTVIEASL